MVIIGILRDGNPDGLEASDAFHPIGESDEPVFLCDVDIAGRQTLISKTVLEIAPIDAIAEAFLSPSPECPGGIFHRGIERECLRAFEEEKLWSESPTTWAMPAFRTFLSAPLTFALLRLRRRSGRARL